MSYNFSRSLGPNYSTFFSANNSRRTSARHNKDAVQNGPNVSALADVFFAAGVLHFRIRPCWVT